ncbi:MAG TPA: TIGR00269 family protein [Candidatus Bathyarchaeota archaeon]|nr:TIGR00269 family protein [Candidatus Bathyarchaeota archaeon]HEW89823.1 TIGR00269 family protein [Candidatus Bathyarchaeota archaeon]
MRRRKCRFCGREAEVLVRQANLPLCKEHFVSWFERRVERTVRRYKMIAPGDKVLVAVSGGKDSLALLCALRRLSERMGFELAALTLDLGIKGNSYSDESVKMARGGAKALGVEHYVVSIEERYGFTLDEAVEVARRPPCSLCGLLKRYALTDVARELGFDVLATGHTLDDVARFLLASYLSASIQELIRLTPVSPSELPGVPRRVKPFYESLEEHIELYANIMGLKYMRDGCPYARTAPTDRFRSFLDQVEAESPGMKHMMVRGYVKHIRPALISGLGTKIKPARPCSKCGLPSSGEVCSFCRLRSRILRALGKA